MFYLVFLHESNQNQTEFYFLSFRKRYATELSYNVSQNLAKQRAKAFNQEVAEHFYGILRNKLLELNLMNKPECILNCDESGFCGSYGRKKVFTRRGERNVHTFTADNEKLMYTVIVS